MFNSVVKSGHGGIGNYMKELQTASVNKLLINDKNGSTLQIDTYVSVNMKFDSSGNSFIEASSKQIYTIGDSEEFPDGKSLLKRETRRCFSALSVASHYNKNILLKK